MFFETAEDLQRNGHFATAQDFAALSRRWAPSSGAYFGAAAGQAFDRTSGVRAYENIDIWNQERKARNEGSLVTFANEDEFKASEHYRKGIQFEKGMSTLRAGIYAENYDKRRARERIIMAGDENGEWYYGAMGFGAGLLGSLPDPVNLIPFGGGAITGARLAGMTAKQVAARSLKVGLVEGAAGNFVSAAYAQHDLNPKGESMTAQDVMLDTMFGAIAGPLFHGAGSFLSRGTARKRMRGDVNGIIDALPENSPLRDSFGNTLAQMKQGDARTYAGIADTLDTIRRNQVLDYMRRNISVQDRMEVARAFEFALTELTEGRPIDMERLLKETGLVGRLYDLALRQRVNADPHGEHVQIFYNRVANDLESVNLDIGTVDADGKIIQELNFGVVKILVAHGDLSTEPVKKRVTRENVLAIPRILREYEARANDLGGHHWIVQDEHGRYVQYAARNFADTTQKDHIVTVHVIRKAQAEGRGISKKKRAVPVSSEEGFMPSSEIPRGELINQQKASSRSATGQVTAISNRIAPDGGDVNGSSKSSSISGGDSAEHPIQKVAASSPPDGDAGPSVHGRALVDGAEKLDWRVETPEHHDPLPPLSKEPVNVLEQSGIDPKTGISLEERSLAHMEAEGRLRPEDRQDLLAHSDESARIAQLEDKALSVAECVMKVTL